MLMMMTGLQKKITDEILDKYPNLKGIYITGSGVLGVCKSLQKANKIKDIKNYLLMILLMIIFNYCQMVQSIF